MSETEDYQFEMYDSREKVLEIIANCCRDNDLLLARQKATRVIQRNKHCDTSTVKAFKTSFDKAKELVTTGKLTTDEYDIHIEIERMPPILHNHDGEIKQTEIEGETESVLKSVKESPYTWKDDEVNQYPIVTHTSGYRVCTCPAQKYRLVCWHTIARVMERNLPFEEVKTAKQ